MSPSVPGEAVGLESAPSRLVQSRPRDRLREGESRVGFREVGTAHGSADDRRRRPRYNGADQRHRPMACAQAIHRRGTGRGNRRMEQTARLGLEADPRHPLGVRLLGRGAGRAARDVRQGRLRGRLRHAERQAADAAAAEHGPAIHRPAARQVASRRRGRRQGKALDESHRLDNPIDISALVPERPYCSSPTCCATWRLLRGARRASSRSSAEVRRLLIVGGSGPIVDMANNQRVHDLILGFLQAGKPIGAECYGVDLPGLRPRPGRPQEHHLGQARHRALQGVRLQGRHRLPRASMFNMGPPPYPLEYILRDATGPGGRVHRQRRPRDVGHRRLPVHHRPLDPDSYLTGEKMVEVLEQGLTR